MGKTQNNLQEPTAKETPQQKLERLIREQGVKPFDGDFSKIDARWTPEYNFDGFDEWYAQYKAEQRSIPPKKRIL